MKIASSIFGNGRLRAAFFMSMALAWSVVAAVLFVPPPGPASAQFVEQSTYGGTSGGAANAQTISIANLRGNTPGVVLRFIPGFTNTGPATLNAGFGNVAIVRPSSIGNVALSGAELLVGELTSVIYNGTAYQLASNVDMTPIGRTVEYRGSATPRGALIEDGSCVSQTTYAPLFSVIGTTYGSCSAGLFALPDSRGTMFAALDTQGVNGAANRITSAGSGCTATAVGLCGSQNHTLLVTEVPALSFSGTTGNDSPDHSHAETAFMTSSGVTAPASGGPAFLGGNTAGQSTGGASTRHQHPFSGTTSGGGGAHSVLNPISLGRRAIKY
jgi:microcystin-dependent protein